MKTGRVLSFLAVLCFVTAVAHALTFEQKTLKAFKRGGYESKNIRVLADSVVALKDGDTQADSLKLRDSLQVEVRRLEVKGYLYNGNNKILLTTEGKIQADLVP